MEFEGLYSTVLEKDEQYKKLSPRMKKAVDGIFQVMDDKPSDFLNTFEKTIKNVAKKNSVPEKDLIKYFEREILDI